MRKLVVLLLSLMVLSFIGFHATNARLVIPELFKKSNDDSYIVPSETSAGVKRDIGATADRVPNIYADNVDSTSLSIGSASTGDLDMNGNDILNIDSSFYSEKAGADASVAGKGQIWVKNDVPNTLYFTDDAGTDTQLGVGGGGGGYADWVTAGTGGTYTDISAAITAGKDHIVMQSSFTESANIVVPSTGLLLDVNGYTLTMGDLEFTTAGAYPITVLGRGGEINFTHLDTVDLFSVAFGTKITLRDLNIKNLGTNNTAISSASNAILDFDNVDITVGNVSSAGISIQKNDIHRLNNVTLIGGGASAASGLVISGSAKVLARNLYIKGQWGTGATTINSFGNDLDIDGLLINVTGTTAIGLEGTIKNMNVASSLLVSININASNAQISGMKGVDINLNLFGYGDLVFSDIDFGTGGIVDGAGGLGNFFTNMIINDPATILGDKYKFTNVTFLGGATNSGGADDNDYVGCQFGSNTGGGANTMTISSAANRTSLTGCRGDVIYSNSGTGTSIVGWQTY